MAVRSELDGEGDSSDSDAVSDVICHGVTVARSVASTDRVIAASRSAAMDENEALITKKRSGATSKQKARLIDSVSTALFLS